VFNIIHWRVLVAAQGESIRMRDSPVSVLGKHWQEALSTFAMVQNGEKAQAGPSFPYPGERFRSGGIVAHEQ
jgi:hypothetical protein